MTRHSVARQAERGLLGFFVISLLWLPLPLASNRPWSMALVAAVVWVLLALAGVMRAVFGPDDTRERTSPGGHAVLALLVLFCAWVGWQLSGHGYTEDRFETKGYLLRSLTDAGAFWLIRLLVTSDRRRMLLLGGLLTAGVLQALIAMVLFSAGSHYEMLGNDMAQGFRAMGTFTGPDALANYLVFTLAAGLAVMLAQMGSSQHPPARTWQARIHSAMEFMMSGKMLVRILLIMMVIALVLTRSRMGNGVFFAGLFLVALWVMLRSPQLRRPAAILVVSMLVIDLIIIGQWVGLSRVIDRMKDTEIAAQTAAEVAASAQMNSPELARAVVPREETLVERTRPARDAMAMIHERPWTGFGAGAFYTAFPRYKVESLVLPYNHAHNDYVEIAADTGLPGLALLAGVMLLTLGRVAVLMSDRSSTHVRGVAAGVGMGLICALLHAMVDLNLQINANAMTLIVLLAVIWSIPAQRSTSSHRSR